MRIAVLTVSRLKGQGGKEAAISMVSRGLVARGHDVSVALAGPSGEREWEAELPGLLVGRLPMTWSAARRYPGATVRFLVDLVRDRRPDVVVATEPGGVGLLRLACLVGRVSLPAVVSWVHGDIERMSYYRLLRCCDGHLAISEGIANQISQLSGSRETVEVVWNPIREPARLVGRPRPGLPKTFLFIGRIEWQKRLDRLLTILAEVRPRNWRLEVVGDGALCTEMQTLAVTLGLQDRITWRGWLADPWSVVTEADAFLMTSETEGFPLVLLEAAARGVPLIAMDCRFGPSEIVEPGRNGWLVPAGGTETFEEILSGVCAGTAELPDAATVRETVARFRLDAVLDAFERGLDRAVRRRASRLR